MVEKYITTLHLYAPSILPKVFKGEAPPLVPNLFEVLTPKLTSKVQKNSNTQLLIYLNEESCIEGMA